MHKESVKYMRDIEIPPAGWVRVPPDLAREIPGHTAYFTWPIRAETLEDAQRLPNGESARKIRALSF